MASSRTVVVAGAGIGGLTTALTLAQHNFRVVLLEAAERLEETGAGIQLSPNATNVLLAIGVGERLKSRAVAPEAIRILAANSGRNIARIPLGDEVAQRYGAPYWVVHRGDLQAALVETLEATPDVVLRLGCRVEDFAVHANGITVMAVCTGLPIELRRFTISMPAGSSASPSHMVMNMTMRVPTRWSGTNGSLTIFGLSAACQPTLRGSVG